MVDLSIEFSDLRCSQASNPGTNLSPEKTQTNENMVRCERCQHLHKKCDGDGTQPCSRCTDSGIECKYVKKRKTGPRQGWVNKLKTTVQRLERSKIALNPQTPAPSCPQSTDPTVQLLFAGIKSKAQQLSRQAAQQSRFILRPR